MGMGPNLEEAERRVSPFHIMLRIGGMEGGWGVVSMEWWVDRNLLSMPFQF